MNSTEVSGVRHAFIPAAGKGTRMAPITHVVPKELLPIGTTPAIHHLIAEAAASGITSVTLIIARGKEAVYESCARQQWYTPDDTPIEITFQYQEEQRGLAHALACAYKNNPLPERSAVLLPDDVLWWAGSDTPTPLTTLLSSAASYDVPIVGCSTIARSRLSRYGIISPAYDEDQRLRITGIIEKPADPAQAPSSLAIVGRYILPAPAGDHLIARCLNALHDEREVLFTDVLLELGAPTGPVGVVLPHTWHDLGSLEGYAGAWRSWLETYTPNHN